MSGFSFDAVAAILFIPAGAAAILAAMPNYRMTALVNVAAGYGFAKLRFAGRDRIFKILLGALVIPSQQAE